MNADFQLLSGRTFHPDEANQAFTTGRLLETGRYEYRPDDHHGPTLYYAAAALQKAAGHDTLASMDGDLLRCTPLVFAVLALAFGFLAIRKLARHAPGTLGGRLVPALFALLLGTSPIFAFFATDFIQEMLLACFTLMMFWAGAGYFHSPTADSEARGARVKPGTWALLFGIAAGLAFATKETSIIAFAAAGLAGIPLAWRFRNAMRFEARDAVLALAGFALTSVLFFSSFASSWQGVYDAFVAAPLSYLVRAAGSAASAGAADHVHPWWQYLFWLFAGKHGFFAFFVLCGTGTGLFARFGRPTMRPDARNAANRPLGHAFMFSLAYAILLLAFYSLIPYKTPWCALQTHTALLLAAMLGFATASDMFIAFQPSSVPPQDRPAAWKAGAALWRSHPRAIKAISLLPLAIASIALLWGNVGELMRMRRDPDSKEIPYNYASASPEVKQLAAAVASAMEAAANREPTPFVAVALPPADTWPFPWYNRPYEPQTGYWTSFEDLRKLAEGGSRPAVVIVPMAEGHLVQPLFPHLKNTKRFYMRPGVRVRVFW